MGIVFAALGEYEEALAHYKSSLKLDQELGDRSAIALKLGNIGQCYADLGDLERGESYLSKALKVAEQTGDPLEHGRRADLARPGALPARRPGWRARAVRARPRPRAPRTASATRRSARSSTCAWPSSRAARRPRRARARRAPPPSWRSRRWCRSARSTAWPLQGLALARLGRAGEGVVADRAARWSCSARPSSRRAPSRSSTSTPGCASWPAGSTTPARRCARAGRGGAEGGPPDRRRAARHLSVGAGAVALIAESYARLVAGG